MLTLILRRPAFRRLFLAGSISLIGDWLSFVAVSLLSMDRGGGVRSLALAYAAHALPLALFAPIAGVTADRFDRRRVLLTAQITQAALTLLMALAAVRGAVGAVQALVFVRGVVAAFVAPAETAALRHTVQEDELLRANALVSSAWSVTLVMGMLMGGAVAMLGPGIAMLLDASTFVVAALLLRGLPPLRSSNEEPHKGSPFTVIAAVPSDMMVALRHALARADLARRVFGKAPVAIAGGAGFIALNLIAGKGALFVSAAASIGVLQAVRGAGTGLGPWFVSALPKRLYALADHGAVALTMVGVALLPLVGSAPLVIAASLAWGMGGGSNWVLSSEGLQRLAPDAMMGRLASVDELATTTSAVLGALLAAEIIERTGSIGAAAMVASAIGGAMWWWLWRERAGDARQEAAIAG